MSGYQSDRSYSDGFVPALRALVGPLLLKESPLEQDREQAADLVVFTTRNLTIGCRVRRPGYADRYPWEFTLRAHRTNGARTELAKLVDGWGDWMVYGHDAGDGASLSRWFVIDLNVFRARLIRDQNIRKQAVKMNSDGSTGFVAYDVRAFPANLIIAAKPKVPYAARTAA